MGDADPAFLALRFRIGRARAASSPAGGDSPVLDTDEILSHPALRGLILRTARPPRESVDALALDADDIGQELRLSLLLSSVDFDPERGSVGGFSSVVLARAASGLRRRRGRRERHGRPLSLGELGGEELQDDRAPVREGARDLRLDLMDVLAELPPDLLLLASHLLLGTVAEVARAQGVPRSTLARRIGELRRRFQEAGLEIYT